MEESWEDLLCRVYLAGYEDCQRERDFDPKSVKVVHTARIRANLLEQRIRELESEWLVSYWLQDNLLPLELGRWVEVKAQTEQDAVDLATALREAGLHAEIEEPPR